MNAITAYHRPDTLSEVIALLARADVTTTLVAGGTTLTASILPPQTEVVDIQQAVGTLVETQADRVVYGAMIRLADVIEADATPPLIAELAHREGPNTLRNASTLGGTVAEGSAESELIAGLLVHQCAVAVSGQESEIPLEVLMADWSLLDRAVITSVSVQVGGTTSSARTGRTPADTAIVAAAARRSPDGVRIALTGVAAHPVLVDPGDLSALDPPADFRGSQQYRRELAEVLTRRVVNGLGETS